MCQCQSVSVLMCWCVGVLMCKCVCVSVLQYCFCVSECNFVPVAIYWCYRMSVCQCTSVSICQRVNVTGEFYSQRQILMNLDLGHFFVFSQSFFSLCNLPLEEGKSA
jgi:hypothetical protein